jgi:hypothetical protein
MTVFINGVATEVPRGPIDLRSMFGQDVMLVHSTGGLLPVNEYGVLMQSLQMGESYFLVSLFIIHGISQYSTFPLMHLYIYIYIYSMHVTTDNLLSCCLNSPSINLDDVQVTRG